MIWIKAAATQHCVKVVKEIKEWAASAGRAVPLNKFRGRALGGRR